MSNEPYTPDTLADLLDILLPPGQPQQISANDDPLVQAAAWVASVPQPRMSPDVFSRIESQVLQASAKTSSKVIYPRFNGLSRLVLVASFLLVVIFAGGIPTALASVPGDVLYPIKQTIERAELTFANSPEAQVSVYMTHVERRMREAQTLVDRRQFNSEVIKSAYSSLAAAGQIASQTVGFDPKRQAEVSDAAAQLDTQIKTILVLADSLGTDEQSTIPPALTEIAATRNSIFAPPLPTATPSPIPTTAPTSMSEIVPTTVLTETPAFTPTATLTLTPTLTPTATATATALPVNLVVEGPVQSVKGNIIIVYDIEIALPPGHPLLGVLRPGDVIHVEGNINASVTDTPVTAVDVDPADSGIEVNEGGETWRDPGDCSNPPPAWAPAHGWRARCEGGEQPGGGNDNHPNSGQGNNGNDGQGNPNSGGQGNNGNNQGQGNNNRGGQGQGQGNNKGRGN